MKTKMGHPIALGRASKIGGSMIGFSSIKGFDLSSTIAFCALILALFLGLASCGKNDDPTEAFQSSWLFDPTYGVHVTALPRTIDLQNGNTVNFAYKPNYSGKGSILISGGGAVEPAAFLHSPEEAELGWVLFPANFAEGVVQTGTLELQANAANDYFYLTFQAVFDSVVVDSTMVSINSQESINSFGFDANVSIFKYFSIQLEE